jgi:hypothetical protein
MMLMRGISRMEPITCYAWRLWPPLHPQLLEGDLDEEEERLLSLMLLVLTSQEMREKIWRLMLRESLLWCFAQDEEKG